MHALGGERDVEAGIGDRDEVAELGQGHCGDVRGGDGSMAQGACKRVGIGLQIEKQQARMDIALFGSRDEANVSCREQGRPAHSLAA
ncbi:hypothetical protein GCM10007067_13310 [Lysobacter bugurensis]|uniref:Uncharacterized protein n=1 Tax=Cognatilysobacter bugurensis TaxID=543356 RepID=A0A918SXE8_9GAMM|nr:hypothetical protein GCM10007067_13310 [Lysobacter bugurensis]